MSRLLTAVIVLLAGAAMAGAAAAELTRPASLEPAVRFWARVYTEVGTDGGLLHDSRHLDVVYEVLRFPEDSSARSRQHEIDRVRDRYEAILRTLARGKRTGLSQAEARVLALWPDGVSNGTLRAAARRVRFQLGQANKMREGIVRSGAWQDYVERTMAHEGVPVELAALPYVESSYNAQAHSHAGAAGMWQFMRGTGRMFMRVDHVVDERMDPFVATRAAAKLLRQNHDRLEAWPLAITAYNHGAGGMARAARTLGTRDIGEIVARYRGRTFGFASRNFYTSFLAALDVSSDPEPYFGTLQRDLPVEYEVVVLGHYYSASSLRRAFGVDVATLREHNLSLRPSVWSGDKLVPRGFVLRIPRSAGPRPTEIALASIAATDKHDAQHRDRYHRVRRGESLSVIARRYGVSQSELVALNGLRSRHRIRVGQTLRLPTTGGGGGAPSVTRVAAAPSDGVHVVRRGDTLSTIAARYGTSSRQLSAVNGLSNAHRIYPGQELRITPASAGSRTYVVRHGDTLSDIASRHGLSITQLAASNGLSNAHRIYPGQELQVKGGAAVATYRVRRGDTLTSIARRFGVRPSSIAAANDLRNANRLRIGQVLRIPTRG